MGAILGGTFLQAFEQIRVLWPRGRFRSGKSVLSAALAYHYLKSGVVDRVVANMPVKIATPPYAPLLRTFIIFDEAGVAGLDARNFATNNTQPFLAFMGKFQNFLVLPSVIAVDARFRVLSCERVANWFGNRLWLYRAVLDMGYDEDKFRLIRCFKEAAKLR